MIAPVSEVFEPCEDCGEEIEDAPACLVEAFETFDAILCDSCFDNRCESAYQAQFEGELPVSAQEQYERAVEQRRELRS